MDQSVVVHADLVYHDATEQKLDLYLPQRKDVGKDRPLVMFIHGGAWVDRTKEEFACVGKALAHGGLATAIIEYTHSPKKYPPSVVHPVHTMDVAAAVHWYILSPPPQNLHISMLVSRLRANAVRYGYSEDEVFLFGHSAGGHMAGLLALDPKYLAHFGTITFHLNLMLYILSR